MGESHSLMARGNVLALKYYQVYMLAIVLVLLSLRSGGVMSHQTEPLYQPTPSDVFDILTDLGSFLRKRHYSIMNISDKRAIDFGLGRGYSGSQAARHILGLQRVNFAGGPGRKKRSEGRVMGNFRGRSPSE